MDWRGIQIQMRCYCSSSYSCSIWDCSTLDFNNISRFHKYKLSWDEVSGGRKEKLRIFAPSSRVSFLYYHHRHILKIFSFHYYSSVDAINQSSYFSSPSGFCFLFISCLWDFYCMGFPPESVYDVFRCCSCDCFVEINLRISIYSLWTPGNFARGDNENFCIT